MKRNLNIIGSFLGIIGSMLLLYSSITGVIHSAQHNTLNIFATIILPFALVLFVFSIIILVHVLQNKGLGSRNIIRILTIIFAFVIGLLFIWFAIAKSNENIFNAITGTVMMVSSILLLYK